MKSNIMLPSIYSPLSGDPISKKNSQRTEEEIALIVRVMSAIEQITSRPESAHPAKITIPNQKAVLAYQDTNNFFNMNNREKL